MLTTLANVKSYLNINDTLQDNFINMLLPSVNETVENYCNRKFDVISYVGEQHTINHKIFTYNYPIISVEKIERSMGADIDIRFLDDGTYTNYTLYPSYISMLDYKYITMTNKLQWGGHEESYVTIDYTAGYTTIPSDLMLAATKLVALEYKISRENRLGIEAESEGDVHFIYEKKDQSIPLTISSVLDNYRKIRI